MPTQNATDIGRRAWLQMFAKHVANDAGDDITAILNQSGGSDLIAFSGGFPHPATFPREALTENFARILADPASLQYGPTGGIPGLRDWFTGWLAANEGLRPAEDGLLITSGGMEGLGLIAKCLLDPRDRVVVEGPTFMGALVGFQRALAQVSAVPMDEHGMDVDALAVLLRKQRPLPKLIYVIPDYQNPMGVSMSVERRHALVALAREYGVLVAEDVAYRELGFDGERRPSLWSLGPDVVAQVGTFSKTFTPGMRTGWIAAPAPLVAQLVRAKQNTDQCTSTLAQLLLEDYGRSGRFDAGIAESRSFYRTRCELMMSALAEHLPAGSRFTRPSGGFFSWVTVPHWVDPTGLTERGLAARVSFVRGAAFYPDDRGARELRLAFSRVDEDKIPEGIRRLAAVIAGKPASPAIAS
jgi:2-aminoadipate transaminase